MDVGRVLGEVVAGKELRVLVIETFIWDGMGPWMAAQITGRGAVVDPYRLPHFHDTWTPLLSG